eukprot:scaffold47636_cov29-Tisochrysis_lutea.AAC.3
MLALCVGVVGALVHSPLPLLSPCERAAVRGRATVERAQLSRPRMSTTHEPAADDGKLREAGERKSQLAPPDAPHSDGPFSTRWIVSGASALTLLWRRDMATVLCLCGAILNALLSKVLKRLINEARPEGARLTDPGMPSSHAQSLFFFASYISAAAAQLDMTPSLGPFDYLLPYAPSMPATVELKTAVVVVAFATAVVAAGMRVSAGLHTREQVGVGATIGSCVGAGWFTIVQPQLLAIVGDNNQTQAIIVAILVVGALVVASVERAIGAALKKRQ